jgi:archaellum biogenesis protein FlaJ (TadC family)
MPTAIAFLLIAILSLFGSLVCALFYLYVMHAHLPPTDKAAHDSYLSSLDDPFVRAVLRGWIRISAAPMFLLGIWLLRGRRIIPTFVMVIAATVTEIALITPIAGPLGWLGSYIVAVAALIACRRLPLLELSGRTEHAR